MDSEKCVYTLKEIADELHVDKQKVYRFVIRNNISEVHHEALRDVDLMRNEVHRDVAGNLKNGVKYYDSAAKTRIIQAFSVRNVPDAEECALDEAHHDVDMIQDEVHHEALQKDDEVAFLRRQILSMNEQMASKNEQLRRQGDVIDSLNRELEKEREHNREKDRKLMDTLSKLAETQAALAVGQSAEKQTKLAETLIEGKSNQDTHTVYTDVEDEEQNFSKKRGLFQRIAEAITGKR